MNNDKTPNLALIWHRQGQLEMQFSEIQKQLVIMQKDLVEITLLLKTHVASVEARRAARAQILDAQETGDYPSPQKPRAKAEAPSPGGYRKIGGTTAIATIAIAVAEIIRAVMTQ